jgi:hypothetical protein
MCALSFSNPNIGGGLDDTPNASMTEDGNLRTPPLVLRAAQHLVRKVVER